MEANHTTIEIPDNYRKYNNLKHKLSVHIERDLNHFE